MVQLLQDLHFAEDDIGVCRPDPDLPLSQALLEAVDGDHLHCVPLRLFLMENFDHFGEGSLPNDVEHVIEFMDATDFKRVFRAVDLPVYVA